jgi:hypothetical protein
LKTQAQEGRLETQTQAHDGLKPGSGGKTPEPIIWKLKTQNLRAHNLPLQAAGRKAQPTEPRVRPAVAQKGRCRPTDGRYAKRGKALRPLPNRYDLDTGPLPPKRGYAVG